MSIIDWFVDELANIFEDQATDAEVDSFAPLNDISHDDLTVSADDFYHIDDDSALQSVRETIASSKADYYDITGHDYVPLSASDTAHDIIDSVMHASPKQLYRMGTQLEGMNTVDEIYASVADYQQKLLDDNAHHQAIRDANQLQIEAESLIGRTDSLLKR